MVGILHLIPETEGPYSIVAQLLDTAPAGSYLVINHPASDVNAEMVAEGARRYNQSASAPQTRRSHAEVSRFFDGLDLLSPGVVQTHHGGRPGGPRPGGPRPGGRSVRVVRGRTEAVTAEGWVRAQAAAASVLLAKLAE